jgi:hypothetical protein
MISGRSISSITWVTMLPKSTREMIAGMSTVDTTALTSTRAMI